MSFLRIVILLWYECPGIQRVYLPRSSCTSALLELWTKLSSEDDGDESNLMLSKGVEV